MNILALFGFKRYAAKKKPAKAPRSPAQIVMDVLPVMLRYKRLVDSEADRATRIYQQGNVTVEALDQIQACNMRVSRILRHMKRIQHVQLVNQAKSRGFTRA